MGRRRDHNREAAGGRALNGEDVKAEWTRAAESAPGKMRRWEGLAALAEAVDLVAKEAWDESTFRTSAPGGDLYTQWHRIFAHGTLPDGQQGAIELHWSEEDGYGHKVIWVRGWVGPKAPDDFTTTRVKRDYIFSNSECGVQ
ncbi:unnamed protein product [Symbiodinium natans]|uniref:Uncharacterized protein n=1 Tax=Symbiodinium natans TaxID=878477 RepID=A0A812IQW7_9DINO|nr:unnamed protein product [Symbiodinium natans]